MDEKVVVISEEETRTDKYGNMFFKDKEGNEHKIGVKRDRELFELIKNNKGRAIELDYAEFNNIKYIASAKLVGMPEVAKEAVKAGAKLEKVEKVKYKADPDKTASIELQVCLKAATDLSIALINAGILKEKITERTITTTKEFSKLFS